MRRFLVGSLLSLLLLTHVGCIVPIYSGDPATRARQLLYTSENLRNALDEWERIWFLDQPDHMTPTRSDGGVI